MRLTLGQHIYTDSLNVYATVAETPGIDRALREDIEQRVQAPPALDCMACRCYPLQRGGLVGLSFLAPRYGARKSHIAHTYLITTADLTSAGWNLPWIALHLPFWLDFRPPAQGIARLQPAEIEIERRGQLRMLRWLLAIAPEPDSVKHWLGGLLLSIADEKTISFSFGEARNLIAATQETLGLQAPAGPDALNLWRAVGLLALIPGVFQQTLSVAINEPGGSGVGLAIPLLGEPPTRFPSVGADVYLDHCLTLLERGEDADLQAFQDAIGDHVGSPSVAVLEAVARYWLASVASPDPIQRVMAMIRFWEELPNGLATATPVNLNTTVALLRQPGLAAEARNRLLSAFLRKGVSGSVFADPSLAADILAALLAWDAPLHEQRRLLCELPKQATNAIWRLSEQFGQPPARVVTNRDLRFATLWTDALFDRLTTTERQAGIDLLRSALLRISQGNPGTIARLVIEELSDVLQLSAYSRLRDDLMSQVAEAIYRLPIVILWEATRGSDPFNVILEHAISSEARLQTSAQLGAKLADRSWSYSPARVQDYILNLPMPADPQQLAARQRFCREAQSRATVPGLRLLASAQSELLEFLMGSGWRGRLSIHQTYACLDLSNYQRWAAECGPKPGFFSGLLPPEERRRFVMFHRNLRNIVRAWPVLDGMCIALSYLTRTVAVSPSTTELFAELVRQTCYPANRAEVIAWLSDLVQPRQTSVRNDLHSWVSPWAMLALFAETVERQPNEHVASRNAAWEMLSEVVWRVATAPARLAELDKYFRRLGISRALLKGFT